MKTLKTQNCTTRLLILSSLGFSKSRRTVSVQLLVKTTVRTALFRGSLVRSFGDDIVTDLIWRCKIMRKKHATLVVKVHSIMTRLLNQIFAAKVKNYTSLNAQTNISTRCALSFSTHKRHKKIKEFNDHLYMSGLNEKLLTSQGAELVAIF